MKHNLRIISVLSLALFTCVLSVQAAGEEGEFDAIGHTGDGNYMDFSPFGKLELPRIFLTKDASGSYGLDFFFSTHAALQHGNYVASYEEEHDGEKQLITASTEAEIASLVESHKHIYADLAPRGGEVVVDFSITRHLVFLIIVGFLVCLVFIRLANRYKKGIGTTTAPKGIFQNMFESMVMFIRDDIAQPNLGNKADRHLPYLLSVFFIILFCNLFGLVPFSGTATANITVTAVLAMFTFFVTQFAGTADYWKHIFWPPGIPIWMKPILIPIEIMGMFTKPFALAIRLFANMTAGHLVILNFVGLIFIFNDVFESDAPAYGISIVSVAMSLFIYFIELLVAFIQAYVFTILSALFIGMAVEEHHGAEEHATAH